MREETALAHAEWALSKQLHTGDALHCNWCVFTFDAMQMIRELKEEGVSKHA